MKIIKKQKITPLEFKGLMVGDIFGFIHDDFLCESEKENVFLKTDEGIVNLKTSVFFKPSDYDAMFECDIIKFEESLFHSFLESLEYQPIFLYNAELIIEKKEEK